MWIKTKDGRLCDTAGCIVHKDTMATKKPNMNIRLVPYAGEPVVVAFALSDEAATRAMQYIENALANGRLLIQLE